MAIPILTIAGYAIEAMTLIPQLISAGRDVSGFAASATAVLKTAQDSGQDIPDAAWDEMRVIREDLQRRLHAPGA